MGDIIKTSSVDTAIKRFLFDLMMAMTIKQGKRGAAFPPSMHIIFLPSTEITIHTILSN